ncbi:MAG: hypothetical protein ACI91T_003173 [Natronomonas sp.]|jgi:uncharacterized protein (DUF2249 family)
MDETAVLDHENVPDRDHVEKLDVRDLPPPKPLQETLETLEALGDDGILLQTNDRTPKHLLPKLEERGYAYESVGDGPAYTAIWKP